MNIGSGNDLAPSLRQQAITFANVDPDKCRHMVSLGHNELNHWGRDGMASIVQMTFSNSFPFCVLIQITVKYVLKGPINDELAMARLMAWHPPGDKPILDPILRDHFVHVTSQWETMLQFNVLCHWLGELTKWLLQSLFIDASMQGSASVSDNSLQYSWRIWVN